MEDGRSTVWRLVPLETVSAAWAMALEEALVGTVEAGGPPTLRLWRCEPRAASIGRFQDVDAEVDLEYCHLQGIDVVRRMSGGGAVFHDEGRELCYSVTAPEAMFPGGVVGAYSQVLGRVIEGLSALGVEPWVKDDNNLMVGERKVSGNSQRRSRGVMQLHGTVLVAVDEEVMFSVLRARSGQPAPGRATPSRHHPVVGLGSLVDLDHGMVCEAIVKALKAGRPFNSTSWTEGELTVAEDLVTTKYGTDGWNLFL
jgi:lipoate-protein ligase A